jgi:hypothetical protein
LCIQEIIQQLIKLAKPADQATKAVQVMGQFIKDKYPMAGSYADSLLSKNTRGKGPAIRLKIFPGKTLF